MGVVAVLRALGSFKLGACVGNLKPMYLISQVAPLKKPAGAIRPLHTRGNKNRAKPSSEITNGESSGERRGDAWNHLLQVRHVALKAVASNLRRPRLKMDSHTTSSSAEVAGTRLVLRGPISTDSSKNIWMNAPCGRLVCRWVRWRVSRWELRMPDVGVCLV